MVDPFHIKGHKVSFNKKYLEVNRHYKEPKCDLNHEDCEYHPNLPKYRELSKDVNMEICEQVDV